MRLGSRMLVRAGRLLTHLRQQHKLHIGIAAELTVLLQRAAKHHAKFWLVQAECPHDERGRIVLPHHGHKLAGVTLQQGNI